MVYGHFSRCRCLLASDSALEETQSPAGWFLRRGSQKGASLNDLFCALCGKNRFWPLAALKHGRGHGAGFTPPYIRALWLAAWSLSLLLKRIPGQITLKSPSVGRERDHWLFFRR
jgi:hypothetical protein